MIILQEDKMPGTFRFLSHTRQVSIGQFVNGTFFVAVNCHSEESPLELTDIFFKISYILEISLNVFFAFLSSGRPEEQLTEV